MGKVKECLGNYDSLQGQCELCPLALLCIDTAMAIDTYYDKLADRQMEIEEMEADVNWTQRV